MWLSNRLWLAVLLVTCLLPCCALAEELLPAATIGKAIKPLPIDFTKRLELLTARAENYRGMPAREVTALRDQLAFIEEYYGPDDLRAQTARRWIEVAEHAMKLSRQQQREVAKAHGQLAGAKDLAETRFKYDLAIKLLTEAHATFAAHCPKRSIAAEQAQLALGNYLEAAGRSQEAESHLTELEAELRLALAPQHPMLAEVQVARAHALISLSRTDEAEPALQEALPVLVRCYGRQDRRTAQAQLIFARLYNATERPADAERAAYAAIGNFTALANYDFHLRVFTALASSQRRQGQLYEAQSTLAYLNRLLDEPGRRPIFDTTALDALLEEELALAGGLEQSKEEVGLLRERHQALRQSVLDRLDGKDLPAIPDIFPSRRVESTKSTRKENEVPGPLDPFKYVAPQPFPQITLP